MTTGTDEQRHHEFTTGDQTMTHTDILLAAASFKDAAAITELLSSHELLEHVRDDVKPGHSARIWYYHRPKREARYLVSDGETVAIYSVTDVSVDEALIIFKQVDKVTEFTRSALGDIIARVIGGRFLEVH
jgi:hypothetical protein